MKRLLAILILCIVFVTGCSNDSSYNSYMEQGKSSVVESDYEKAKEFFMLALEEKKNDKEAKLLNEQIEKLIKAIDLKGNGQIGEAIALCNEIDKVNSESDVVKSACNKLKETWESEIEKMENLKKNIKDEIHKSEKLFNEGKYSEAKEILVNIKKGIEDEKKLEAELDECNKLIEKCEAKIEEIEKKKEKSSKVYGYNECAKIAVSYAKSRFEEVGIELPYEPSESESYNENGIWYIQFCYRLPEVSVGIDEKTLKVVYFWSLIHDI